MESQSSESITIRWPAVPNATGYVVFANNVMAYNGSTIPDQLTFTLTGEIVQAHTNATRDFLGQKYISKGAYYNFTMRVANKAGWGPIGPPLKVLAAGRPGTLICG